MKEDTHRIVFIVNTLGDRKLLEDSGMQAGLLATRLTAPLIPARVTEIRTVVTHSIVLPKVTVLTAIGSTTRILSHSAGLGLEVETMMITDAVCTQAITDLITVVAQEA